MDLGSEIGRFGLMYIYEITIERETEKESERETIYEEVCDSIPGLDEPLSAECVCE